MAAGQGGWTAGVLRPVLTCASIVYRQLVGFRNARFDQNPHRAFRVNAPVISVGNITVGGTGKTPVVIDLVGRLVRLGRRPAVIARGYGAEGQDEGDEQLVITRAAPSVVYVADPDRRRGAARALERDAADVIILDDGFQHRRLARDLDIVLIDATRPFGFGYLLPRGLLREPADGLSRCDLIILTRCDLVEPGELERIESAIRRHAPHQPLVRALHAPADLVSLAADARRTRKSIDQPVYLMSAIGNPEALAESVKSLGISVCGASVFDDHHRYCIEDLQRVCRLASSAGAGVIITTEKDAVKLSRIAFDWPIEVWVLRITVKYLDGGDKVIDDALRRCMESREAH